MSSLLSKILARLTFQDNEETEPLLKKEYQMSQLAASEEHEMTEQASNRPRKPTMLGNNIMLPIDTKEKVKMLILLAWDMTIHNNPQTQTFPADELADIMWTYCCGNFLNPTQVLVDPTMTIPPLEDELNKFAVPELAARFKICFRFYLGGLVSMNSQGLAVSHDIPVVPPTSSHSSRSALPANDAIPPPQNAENTHQGLSNVSPLYSATDDPESAGGASSDSKRRIDYPSYISGVINLGCNVIIAGAALNSLEKASPEWLWGVFGIGVGSILVGGGITFYYFK